MSDNLPIIVYSIRNHLGYEVGTVQSSDPTFNPIAAYATKVNASYAKLLAAGYTYKRI